MSHKKIKFISISIIVISIIGLLIGCFVDWKFPTWIYFSGSSTIQPLIQKISKIYNKSEIIADAGGSSTGINNVLNQKKDVGMLSKTPSFDLVGLPNNQDNKIYQDNEKWSNLKIKTITIAYDAIGLIYKINGDKELNLDINENNINLLYEIFQGNKEYNLSQLMSNASNVSIIPFARTGGAELSGTAEAFLTNSNLINQSNPISQSIYESLKTGKYGKITQTTSESNLQTWQAIKDFELQQNQMSITYLSAGFIKNNLKEILDNGFKIATYKNIELISSSTNDFNIYTGYKWYRPFNLLVRLLNIPVDIKNFINWYLTETLIPNSLLSQEIKNAGYIVLKQNEYQTMCLNNNDFYKSDFEILNNPEQLKVREKNKIYYGAYL